MKSRGDEEAECRIIKIIAREKQRSYWCQLNFTMCKSKGRHARVVAAETDEVTEFEGHLAVESTIWNGIHNKCFYLAE